MHYEIANRNASFRVTDDIHEYIEEEVGKLDPLVESFPPETMLRVVFDEGGNSQDIAVQLRLSLPSRMLTSHEAADNYRKACEIAFKELRRQLIDFKKTLRGPYGAKGH